MWMGYTETDPRFPDLGTGGAPTGGPRYDFDPDLDNPAKFPEYYDRHWFIGEWNNGWIKTATLDDQGDGTGVFQTPFDGHVLPAARDGVRARRLALRDRLGRRLQRQQRQLRHLPDRLRGGRKTPDRARDVERGQRPDSADRAVLERRLASTPTARSLTYAWDFDGNGTTDSTDANPTHTYATAGTFNATLTVTDADGQTAFDTIPITAGNTRPTVTITVPEDGQFAAFGDIVPYEITVTDPEDGTIDCNRRHAQLQLGHDDHAHGLGQQTGLLRARSGRQPTAATARTRTSSRRSSRPTRTTRRARPTR